MTEYGPEFAAKMAHDSAPVTPAQINRLATIAMQLRDHNELPDNSPFGVSYSNALWRQFRVGNVHVWGGLIEEDKPYPSLHLRMATEIDYAPDGIGLLFRVDDTSVNNKAWFYRKAKYEATQHASRYMLGDEEPEERLIVKEYVKPPKDETRRFNIISGTRIDLKFDSMPLVHGSNMTVSRLTELTNLLSTVIDTSLPITELGD